MHNANSKKLHITAMFYWLGNKAREDIEATLIWSKKEMGKQKTSPSQAWQDSHDWLEKFFT
jgi:hypothetical protein